MLLEEASKLSLCKNTLGNISLYEQKIGHRRIYCLSADNLGKAGVGGGIYTIIYIFIQQAIFLIFRKIDFYYFLICFTYFYLNVVCIQYYIVI